MMWLLASYKKKIWKYFFCILKIIEERNRIRSWIWIRIHNSQRYLRIRGSGFAPKCHGSPTLLCTLSALWWGEPGWGRDDWRPAAECCPGCRGTREMPPRMSPPGAGWGTCPREWSFAPRNFDKILIENILKGYCPAKWIPPKVGSFDRERRGVFLGKSSITGWGTRTFF